mgnify:CR=1 FL=1
MLRFLFSVLFFSLILPGDQTQELPIGFTPKEWQNRDVIKQWGNRTDPPPGPVRNVAEYDPMQGVLIRYPFGISTSVIREMAEDVIVYCLVSSSSQNSAYNSMNNADVNMDNVEFILGSTQTLTNIDIKEPGTVAGLWNTHRSDMTRSGYYLSSVDALSTGDDIENYEFALYDAYPNPFNPSTTIGYEVPYSMFISLNVYDISGRLVKKLDNGFKNTGIHSIVWDGKDNFGNTVSNGLYIYRLDSDADISISNKIIFMK